MSEEVVMLKWVLGVILDLKDPPGRGGQNFGRT